MKNVSKKRSLESGASRHALHGLALPGSALKALQKRGIYCTPGISVEHQHLARRYVLRGVESGGAVSDMGRACAFVSPDGLPLAWLQRLDSIAVNGRHAIFLSDSLVRIEMLRSARICELAVTFHALSHVPGRARPEITSKSLFRGRDGVLPLELWKAQHHALRGMLAPIFYDRAGELLPLPQQFEDAIRKITAAVCCVGCKHTHVGVPPVTSGEIA
jgi:hypothetical protein